MGNQRARSRWFLRVMVTFGCVGITALHLKKGSGSQRVSASQDLISPAIGLMIALIHYHQRQYPYHDIHEVSRGARV